MRWTIPVLSAALIGVGLLFWAAATTRVDDLAPNPFVLLLRVTLIEPDPYFAHMLMVYAGTRLALLALAVALTLPLLWAVPWIAAGVRRVVGRG